MILENQLLQDTHDATHYITQPGQFDAGIAELLMRNIWVAADRLKTPGFKKLSPDAVSLVLDAASIAKTISPLDSADQLRMSYETDAEYSLRTNITGPLLSLQQDLLLPDIDDTKAIETQIAVSRAGRAFEAIITETARIAAPEFEPIRATTHYFMGNAVAAARRAERQARERQNSY